MGEQFTINGDGTIARSVKKTINNVKWLDYKQYGNKWSWGQIIFCVLCLLPIYGWVIGLITVAGIRLIKGFWPILGIIAIEDSDDPIKVYCNADGLLGLYSDKQRITAAKFDSIQQLPTNIYPTFVCEKDGVCCLYNYTRGKFLFEGSERITYVGDEVVLIERQNKVDKYSIIGMRLS